MRICQKFLNFVYSVVFFRGGEGRAAQDNSQGILKFYTDEAPGFQM